jgi:hypothetical protein
VPLIQQLFGTIQLRQDVRKHLVTPLPKDCRLAVRFLSHWLSRSTQLAPRLSLMPAIRPCFSTWSIILATASYAGVLNVCSAPYSALRLSHLPNLQAFTEGQRKSQAWPKQRRHSITEIRPWLRHNDSHFRRAFRRAAIITRVITRLRVLTANSSNSGKVVPTPRPRCGSSFCAYELLSSPLVARSFFPAVKFLVD